MSYIKEMYMEDVHSAALQGLDVITKELKKRGIELSEEQGEEVYLAIQDTNKESVNVSSETTRSLSKLLKPS